MALKLSNNADGLLALAISDSDTSLTLEAGHGSRFPALGSGDWFPITVVRADNPAQLEIMRCTARTLDTLTVERAQEGTSAITFDAGDVVELRLTSGTLEENFPQVEGANAKNLRFIIDSVGGKPELKFKSGDDEETLVRQSDVMTSPTDTTPGRLLTVGAFGLGSFNDLRNTIYATGAPKDLYGKGYVIGFADGSQLSPPIGGPNNYGTLEVKFHWNDISGRAAFSRTFTTEDRVFVQRAVDGDTWGPWRELTPIGVGQTWQAVTLSRAKNTTYTNTTGRTIFVAVTVRTSQEKLVAVLRVDDYHISRLAINNTAGSTYITDGTVFGLVPPGSTYQVLAGDDISILGWMELR